MGLDGHTSRPGSEPGRYERRESVTDESVRIRTGASTDAARLLELKRALDRETSFMLFQPGERHESAEQLATDLEWVGRSENSTVLVAEGEGCLAGYAEARGGEYRRNRHAAYVVIGVRSAVAGRGVGSALLRELIAWAEEQDVHRLELTVMAHNERAIALYRRQGFQWREHGATRSASRAPTWMSSRWPGCRPPVDAAVSG